MDMIKVRKWKNKGISPVIAVLLLIAIAVSIGILTYVWATGLAGSLTAGYHTAQITESLILVVYDARDSDFVEITIKNTGESTISISQMYFDTESLTIVDSADPVNGQFGKKEDEWYVLDSGEVVDDIIVNPTDSIDPGTMHRITIITESGAKFQFIITGGRVG